MGRYQQWMLQCLHLRCSPPPFVVSPLGTSVVVDQMHRSDISMFVFIGVSVAQLVQHLVAHSSWTLTRCRCVQPPSTIFSINWLHKQYCFCVA